MTRRFSWWYVTQVLHHYLLMRNYPKYRGEDTNTKCCLILMLQNQPKGSFFHAQKTPSNHNDNYFNNTPLNGKTTQKHLGLYLNAKLNFSEHINEKIKKTVKGISLIKKLILPRSSLSTIYKLLIRPHLDYGDVKNLKREIVPGIRT